MNPKIVVRKNQGAAFPQILVSAGVIAMVMGVDQEPGVIAPHGFDGGHDFVG